MDVDAINKLKQKVCQEYYTLICKIKKGYRPNYEFLLEEISFIELYKDNELDNKLLTPLQYYLNNKWQIAQY